MDVVGPSLDQINCTLCAIASPEATAGLSEVVVVQTSAEEGKQCVKVM